MTDKVKSGIENLNRSGRPKGAKNMMTRTAKEAIALAAEKLGGAERLVAWVQEDPTNERVFWGTIYPKLLPLQVSNADGEDFRVVARIERRIIDANADD